MTNKQSGPSPDDWEQHWQEANTPWDLAGVTPALIAWARDRDLQNKRVLVPGCGRGYDAHFLAKRGARVTAVDISPSALEAAQGVHPTSQVTWRLDDVTDLPDRESFDLIWEYTCFCALHPSLRASYFASLARALRVGGNYFGLVFQTVPSPDDGPPFQVEPTVFQALLANHFGEPEMEPETTRSIKARLGREIWFSVAKLR